jgi:hypothetical protein
MKATKKIIALALAITILAGMSSCKTGQGCPTFSLEITK